MSCRVNQLTVFYMMAASDFNELTLCLTQAEIWIYDVLKNNSSKNIGGNYLMHRDNEVYLEPSQTSKIELFAKIVNGF